MPNRLICAAAFLTLTLPGAAAAELMLRHGYYVQAQVGCAGASNGTITRVHATGMNHAKAECNFVELTPMTDGSHAFRESCYSSSDNATFEIAGTIQTFGPDRIRIATQNWSGDLVYCPQSAMPEPWRSVDLTRP